MPDSALQLFSPVGAIYIGLAGILSINLCLYGTLRLHGFLLAKLLATIQYYYQRPELGVTPLRGRSICLNPTNLLIQSWPKSQWLVYSVTHATVYSQDMARCWPRWTRWGSRRRRRKRFWLRASDAELQASAWWEGVDRWPVDCKYQEASMMHSSLQLIYYDFRAAF